MNGPMFVENVVTNPNATATASPALLERTTAITLCAVTLSLAWMVSAAYQPDYLRLFPVEAEIAIVLALLLTALVLVSVVALRHTHLPERKEEQEGARGA